MYVVLLQSLLIFFMTTNVFASECKKVQWPYQRNQTTRELHATFTEEAKQKIKELQKTAAEHENVFETLMETSKYCSIGQITNALFNVGGKYRRNM